MASAGGSCQEMEPATATLPPRRAGVAAEWARLRVHLALAGRRVNVNGLWIAATAAAHRLPIVTQDDDFGPVDGVGGLSVIRV